MKYTQKQINRAKELSLKGLSLGEIEKLTGMSKTTIRYHLTSKDRILASTKKWRENNREKQAEYMREYRNR